VRLIRTGAALVALLGATAGCRGRAAAFMPAFDGGFSPPPPARLEAPREVHFTYTGPRAVTFDWRGHSAALRFWTKDEPPRTATGHAPTPVPTSSPGPFQEAVLDDLKPGAAYFYEIANDARAEPAAFRAPPAGPTRFVFAAVGDMGAADVEPDAAGVNADLRIADPSFVLMLGDLSYADLKSPAAVDRHFDDVMTWSRRAAYMPIWGNHEWEAAPRDDLRNYKGRFALPHAAASPGAPAAGCCGEDWYWFDFGGVRFIVYPEPYSATTWPDWAHRVEPLFAEAQADAAINFIVTAGHRPAYSSGHHGGEPQLRAILDELGKRFGKYVLNLNGHSHVYERTKPQAHVVHVTSGIGGGQLEHGNTPCLWDNCTPPPFSAYRTIHHGFVKVSASPDELHVEAVCGPASPGNDEVHCVDGEILDDVVIPRGGLISSAEPRRAHPDAHLR